jgi:hypothetical protein
MELVERWMIISKFKTLSEHLLAMLAALSRALCRSSAQRDKKEPPPKNWWREESTVGRTGLFLLVFLFDVEDFASCVEPALGADGMTADHLAAMGTLHQIHGGQRILGATAVAAALG